MKIITVMIMCMIATLTFIGCGSKIDEARTFNEIGTTQFSCLALIDGTTNYLSFYAEYNALDGASSCELLDTNYTPIAAGNGEVETYCSFPYSADGEFGYWTFSSGLTTSAVFNSNGPNNGKTVVFTDCASTQK